LAKVSADRPRAQTIPQSIEDVYAEAGLPAFRDASAGERRAATNNRRTRTPLANAAGNPAKHKKMQGGVTTGLTNS
jgi:hypothetical protein